MVDAADDFLQQQLMRGRIDGKAAGATLGRAEGATLGQQAGTEIAREVCQFV